MNGYFLEHANFIEANPLKTPEHIAPLWYLTPFYSVLRAEYHHTDNILNAVVWVKRNTVFWNAIFIFILFNFNTIWGGYVFSAINFTGVAVVRPL
jgi:quinol-cytochrome oxidoreductase complex cytochrome b subunit